MDDDFDLLLALADEMEVPLPTDTKQTAQAPGTNKETGLHPTTNAAAPTTACVKDAPQQRRDKPSSAHEPPEPASDDDFDALLALADEVAPHAPSGPKRPSTAATTPSPVPSAHTSTTKHHPASKLQQQPRQQTQQATPAKPKPTFDVKDPFRNAPAAANAHQQHPSSKTTPTILRESLGLKPRPSNGAPGLTAISSGTRTTTTTSHQRLSTQGGYTQKHSGLRVIKPRISSVVVEDRLSDTCYVKVSSVKDAARSAAGAKQGPRWSTVAVLASKASAMTKRGDNYSRWTFSDLNDGEFTIFLWGDAHREHYKESEGSVFLLSGLDSKLDEGRLSLSTREPTALALMGMSPDFGYCQGTTADGSACRNAVNKGACQYCKYHVGAAYKKLRTQRPELQAPGVLRPPPGSTQLHRKQPHPHPHHRASSTSSTITSLPRDTTQQLGMGSAGLRQLEAAKQQQQEQRQAAVAKEIKLQAAAAAAAAAGGRRSSSSSPGHMIELDDGDEAAPAAQPTALRGLMLDPPIPLDARARAKQLLQQRGGLPAPDPNRTRPPSPSRARPAAEAAAGGGGGATLSNVTNQLGPMSKAAYSALRPLPSSSRPAAAGKGSGGSKVQQIAASLGMGPSRSAAAAPAAAGKGGGAAAAAGSSKPSAFAAMFAGVVDKMQSQGQQAGQSRYDGLVDAAEDEALAKVVDSLAKKEEAALKMESITSMQVNGFKCKDCNCVSEKRRAECKEHEVVRVTTLKRWWTCAECAHHFSTVSVTYPNKPCPKCRSMAKEFKSASMYKGKVTADRDYAPDVSSIACRGNLLARGVEHAFSLKS